jgi:HAD superfamily hydrolase (TIGR01490 family)
VSEPVAAYFDVDGTLTRTNTLSPLIWYMRAHLPPGRYAAWFSGLCLQAPSYWAVDKHSRSRFNVVFFRRYAGLPVAELWRWHHQTFPENLQRRLFPAALACVRDHQRQGHRIVLITGGADFVMRPLADLLGAGELIATRLDERDGLCTGALAGPPVADREKATLLRDHAQRHGIELARSFAYGDSHGDTPMLECVGQPVAVNPGRRLRARARAGGWRIVEWSGG